LLLSKQRSLTNCGTDWDAVTRQPIRLLFVTPRYPPYIGGVENHVYQVAWRIAHSGLDVTVLTTDPTGRLPATELSNGVKIQRVRALPKGRDYYFAPAVYRAITRGGWDLVHVQSYHTLVAPLAMLAAWRARIPYVVTFHGGGHSSRLRNSLRGVQRALLHPLLSHAERFVVLAQFEQKLFESVGLPPERFALIPNGSDLPAPARTNETPVDPSLIISIGRLEKYKGHQRILSAMPKILEQQPNAHLWIAGEGPFRPQLERMAQKLGMTDHVEIRAVPATERERMAIELSRAALVVLLSEYETQPIAILEALALGRPVLVADTLGLSELAAQGLARAVSLQSTPDEIASAVLDLLRHPPQPQSICLPSWDDCAASLIALYDEVVGRVACAS
jgi:glycosyltransferase involved in cell wall biosynthesis